MVIGPQINGLLMSQENYDKSSTLWKLQLFACCCCCYFFCFSSIFYNLFRLVLCPRKNKWKTTRFKSTHTHTEFNQISISAIVWFGLVYFMPMRVSILFFFTWQRFLPYHFIEIVAILLCNILNWTNSNRLWNFFFHYAFCIIQLDLFFSIFLSPNQNLISLFLANDGCHCLCRYWLGVCVVYVFTELHSIFHWIEVVNANKTINYRLKS